VWSGEWATDTAAEAVDAAAAVVAAASAAAAAACARGDMAREKAGAEL
jgi:hypothetical protein